MADATPDVLATDIANSDSCDQDSHVFGTFVRLITISFSILVIPLVGRGAIIFSVEAPLDDRDVRAAFGYRSAELQPLAQRYLAICKNQLLDLTCDDATAIFGSKVVTQTNWWGYGTTNIGSPRIAKEHYPARLVLPSFLSVSTNIASRTYCIMVSGLHSSDPSLNKNHTDLHTLGNLGYVELYYQNDGQHIQTALIYFRADEQFVPLKSTNDFEKRLQWDRNRLAAVEVWLQEHSHKPHKVK